MQKKWTLNLVTALLWALAAASAVYWGLRITGEAIVPPAPNSGVSTQAGNVATRQAAMARLLGAQPSEAARPAAGAGERFSLAGVVASAVGEGVALISVDSKPARPFVVGAQIAPGYVLKSVGRREAMLADGIEKPVSMTLVLPGQRSSAAAASPPLSAAAISTPAAPVSPGQTQSIAVPAVFPASQSKEPPASAALAPNTAPAPQPSGLPDMRGPQHGPQ